MVIILCWGGVCVMMMKVYFIPSFTKRGLYSMVYSNILFETLKPK